MWPAPMMPIFMSAPSKVSSGSASGDLQLDRDVAAGGVGIRTDLLPLP
jgi:hypothetical protein